MSVTPHSFPSAAPRAVSQTLRALLLLALLTLGIFSGQRAWANTFTVTSTADDGSAGTLRSQIAAANAGDTIIFDPTVFAAKQTITLTEGTLTVSHSLTLTGPASGVAIDGNKQFAVFSVTGGSASSPVTLSGLTIQNGNTTGNGGGITNTGTATLTNCTLTDNMAQEGGGVNNAGLVMLTSCSISGNSAYSAAGGLFNSGTAMVTGCNVNGNKIIANVGYGGGVINISTVTMTNCTVALNSAPYGAGVLNATPGPSESATLVNCTLTGNIATQAVGSATQATGSIVGQSGSVELTNDIVYGDTRGEVVGFVTATYCDVQGGYTGDGNINADPKFVNTPTDLHLQAGSPCTAAGTSLGAPSTDKDDVTRPNPPSIGAYEAPTYSIVVNTTTDEDNGSPSPALGTGTSLREAIDYADQHPGTVITFDPTVFAAKQTITLTLGQLNVTAAMTITGPAAGVAIDGNHQSTVFNVTGGTAISPVMLAGIIIQNGTATASNSTAYNSYYRQGGGLYNTGAVVLTDCSLLENTSNSIGGGLYNGRTQTTAGVNVTGMATLINCIIAGNSAVEDAAVANFGTVALTNCTLTGNSEQSGPIFYSDGGTATLTNDILYGDSSSELDGFGITATYCDIAGGYAGTGNINTDPLFAYAPGDDFHLLPASLCADAGTASGAPATDKDGTPRANPPSIGAYEAYPVPTLTAVSPTSATAGVGFVLTVTGTGFVPGTQPQDTLYGHGSIISFNGTQVDTKYISPTQLTATVYSYVDATPGTASVTVVTPAPTGVVSNSLPLVIVAPNPTPTLTTLSPASATAGSGNLTLSLTGTGFLSSSTVTFGGTALAVTGQTATQITATVPASLLAKAGADTVTVTNPTPGGGSASAGFTVVALNPAPTVSAISPSSATAGNSAFPLSVSGGGFLSNSVVDWNGAALPTTFVSATQLTAQVPASDVASAGTASVTVVTPAPGGGTSAALPFTVQPVGLYRINAGGGSVGLGAVGAFFADTDYSGGSTFSTSAAINTSGVTNPAPQGVYQTERFGNFVYTLPGLAPGAAYTLRLHFAEVFWNAAGQRLFNVSVNGTPVLTNFDIFQAAGGKNKALVETFPVTANPSGQVVITFSTIKDNAKVSGIELLGSQAVGPTITAAATATPNPVTGTTTTLAVAATIPNASGPLAYTWSGPAGVSFSVNGTTTSASTTATFTQTGSYPIQVTVQAANGLTATSSVTVLVNQTPTTLTVSPSTATVAAGATQQFIAAVSDQFGSPIASPSVLWSVPSAAGTISAGGLLTASATAGGPYSVTATSGPATGTATVTVPSPAPQTVLRINAGGGAVTPFTADTDYTGGSTFSTTAAIGTSGVTNPAPQGVYQTERFGNFAYTVPGLIPGQPYTVRLHFAEVFWNAAGQRLFNVSVNGTPVLTNFDIFQAAGGKNKALVEPFTATPDSNGRITITFTTVKDNAKVSGIEVLSP